MKTPKIIIAALLLSILALPVAVVHAQTEPPVVHAVLFYSPTCGHCEYVIQNTLLPLVEQYGNKLQIAGIDVSQQQGQTLFLSAMQKFGLESTGVPFLVIDDIYLMGSVDIPEQFPDLVETYLAQGGVDWPEIPGLTEILNTPAGTPETATMAAGTETPFVDVPTQTGTVPATPVPATVSRASPSPTVTPGIPGIDTEGSNWRTKFGQDPAGNTLSVIVLLGMLGSIVWTILIFKNTNGVSMKESWAWIIPLLCLIGLAVSGYLAYVETQEVEAVCGPVGNCNTVQQSEYARLFGVLPIGVLGLIGYTAILLAWLVTRYASNRLADLSVLSIFIMTIFGTLFSIYLTFLEPFVIGATCAWCLTSAILMTILMLLMVRPAKSTLVEFMKTPSDSYRQ